MKPRKSRLVLALWVAATSSLLAGCKPAPQTTPPRETPAVAPETQQVAEAALGKQAKVLVRGDLARNGLEQLLVVNQFERAARGGAGPGHSSGIFVTRAVIVEKSNDKWAEVLRCDEHLKNQNGYLGGSPAAPVTGWWLEFTRDTQQGLELRFTPAAPGPEQSSNTGETANRTITVRWNTKTKRYQSLDRSQEGYLGEVPALETPQSILR